MHNSEFNYNNSFMHIIRGSDSVGNLSIENTKYISKIHKSKFEGTRTYAQ